MRDQPTSRRTATKKSVPRAAKQVTDKDAALAKARCTEIAMLAAAAVLIALP